MNSPLIQVKHLHLHLPPVGPTDLGALKLNQSANADAQVRFELSADGSFVTDHTTGIQWATKPSTNSMNYEDAEKYAAGLALGGLIGWIIPTLEQRETIIDRTRFNPAMPTPFESSGYEWTTTPFLPRGNDSNGAPRAFWQVYGYDGYVYCGYRYYYGVVRPCRVVGRPGQ